MSVRQSLHSEGETRFLHLDVAAMEDFTTKKDNNRSQELVEENHKHP